MRELRGLLITNRIRQSSQIPVMFWNTFFPLSVWLLQNLWKTQTIVVVGKVMMLMLATLTWVSCVDHFLMKIIRKLNITIGLHRSLLRKLLSQCVDNCTQVELFKAYHRSVCIFSILFSIHLLRFWQGEFV